jgi:hypothetical protein
MHTDMHMTGADINTDEVATPKLKIVP